MLNLYKGLIFSVIAWNCFFLKSTWNLTLFSFDRLMDMPDVMKQMPPLPVKLNEELATTILPPRTSHPMQSWSYSIWVSLLVLINMTQALQRSHVHVVPQIKSQSFRLGNNSQQSWPAFSQKLLWPNRFHLCFLPFLGFFP